MVPGGGTAEPARAGIRVAGLLLCGISWRRVAMFAPLAKRVAAGGRPRRAAEFPSVSVPLAGDDESAPAGPDGGRALSRKPTALSALGRGAQPFPWGQGPRRGRRLSGPRGGSQPLQSA